MSHRFTNRKALRVELSYGRRMFQLLKGLPWTVEEKLMLFRIIRRIVRDELLSLSEPEIRRGSFE